MNNINSTIRVRKNIFKLNSFERLTPKEFFALLYFESYKNQHESNNGYIEFMITEESLKLSIRSLVKRGYITTKRHKGRVYYKTKKAPDLHYVKINLNTFEQLWSRGFNEKEIYLFFLIVSLYGEERDALQYKSLSEATGLTRREITAASKDFDELIIEELNVKESENIDQHRQF